jgi:hypothetical protein
MSIAAFLHALYPDALTTYASGKVKKIYESMIERNRCE